MHHRRYPYEDWFSLLPRRFDRIVTPSREQRAGRHAWEKKWDIILQDSEAGEDWLDEFKFGGIMKYMWFFGLDS